MSDFSFPIYVMLVDDHHLFRDGVSSLLKRDERFLVLSEANYGEKALELLAGILPGRVLGSQNEKTSEIDREVFDVMGQYFQTISFSSQDAGDSSRIGFWFSSQISCCTRSVIMGDWFNS